MLPESQPFICVQTCVQRFLVMAQDILGCVCLLFQFLSSVFLAWFMSYTVVWWLALSPYSKSLNPFRSLHVFLAHGWASALGTPASSHRPKICLFGLLMIPKLPLEWLCMVVCLVCLCVALWWTSNLSRVYFPSQLSLGLPIPPWRSWID